MGRFKSIKNLIVIASMVLPLFASGQGYPRFELYQLVQGQDSGQFVTTGVDSNLDFNSVMRFRFQDSTLLIGSDTVITDATIVSILLATIDAGLGIEVNQVNGQIFIESLSIEDSIYNGSGSIIAKGTPLYASDTQGNYWDVAPARADDPSKMPVVAIAGDEIGIGEVGLGLIKGHIKQVNTTGLADGSEVYVGATGGYTSTKPTDEGVIIQRLGTVIKGETANGSGIINLGDEGFWNDYTSLTKLRDTLVLVRDSITVEIGDSLVNYASRTELGDTSLAIRNSIPIQIGDSLVNYVSRIELGDSLNLYPNRIELGDTANNIRLDIPTYISDSLINYVSRVELGDTSTNIRTSITSELSDSLTNYPNRTELVDTANNIRTDIPIYISDSLTNYVSRIELGDSLDLYPNRTELSDTASAIRADISSGGITATNQGNNRIPTFDGTNNIIDGLNNYWINEFGEMVDNLSDGTSPNPIGYKFKIDSRLFADSIESNVIETAIGGKANLNSLTTTGFTTFTGTIGGNNTTVYPSGQIGINETPSGNLSLTTYWGALFNNDQYNGVNGDFTVRSANKSSMFFIDSDIDAIGIGDATPNSSFDVNINGGVQINSSAAGGIYDGLIVQGDTDPVLFYVNADRDKVGISEALPNWTLDVDGDINFNGDLYQNDALVTFGGTSIGNNTDNYILTATGVSDSINGDTYWYIDTEGVMQGYKGSNTTTISIGAGIFNTYDGTNGPNLYFDNNSITGSFAGLGLVNDDFYISNGASSQDYIYLLDDGDVLLTGYAGSGNQEIGVDNNGELFFYSSDGRYKTKVNTDISGIESVMKLKPVEYKWDKDMPNYDGHNELGFIAQEVKEAIPLAVPYEEKDVKILGYKHRAITATLTKAIQEQQIIIESQDKRIQQLEEMVQKLIEKK